MDDLFSNPAKKVDWAPKPGLLNPVIELCELALLGTLEPNASKVLRRITFRKGLNIVWADPKVAQAAAGGDRISGHSAGKTTLCRIIRWLLGESRFGNSDLETRIALKFPKGWAVLSVNLDGHTWVVGRSFFSKADHRAAKGMDIDAILENGWPQGASAIPFIKELTKQTIGLLEKRCFPGRDSEIEWIQLLEWLARDQEAALQSVEAWRSSAGGPQERGPDKFERHVLIRLISNLLSKEEWDEMDKEHRFTAKRDEIKEKLPGLGAIAAEACEPLRRMLGSDGEALPGELLLAPATKAVAVKEDQLRVLCKTIAEHPAIQARQTHEQALRELERTKADVARIERRVKRFEIQAGEFAAANLKAQTVLTGRKRPPGCCIKTKDECPDFKDSPEDIGAFAVNAELEKQSRSAQSVLEEEKQEFASLNEKLPFLTTNENNLRQTADTLASDREELVKRAAQLTEQISQHKSVLEPAMAREKAYNILKTENDSLSEEIKEARARQATIRKGRFTDRLELTEHYRAVLDAILKVDGRISFDKDGQLVLEAENRGALSSAAIEALKSLSFDLSALFRSITGGGHHPRFLIHDSPKVADMSPVPYASIFDTIQKVEELAHGKPNFQYIITTTEPPPDKLKDTEFVILKLDASTKEGRLFTEDL